MSDDAIRPGCYELMVGGETGIHSPLAAECARPRPGEQRRQDEENYGKRQAPGPPLHFPKVSLPQDGVANRNENDSRASALVHLLCRLLLFIDKKKRQHPEEPTSN